MGWDVYLRDHSAAPVCSYGIPEDIYRRVAREVHYFEKGHEPSPCTQPCYPLVTVPDHQEGGIIAIGGSSSAHVSITYNYGALYRETLPDPDPEQPNILGRLLHDKRAGDVIPLLEEGVRKLGTDVHDDYWKPTPGNAGHMLNVLLGWARLHPDAIFSVS